MFDRTHLQTKVPFELDHSGLSSRLLSKVCLVEDLTHAREIFENTTEIDRVVTMQGLSVDRQGLIQRLGASAVDQRLESKTEVGRLQMELTGIERELEAQQNDLKLVQKARQDARQFDIQLTEQFRAMKIAGSELSAELKHLTAEKARLSRFVEQANQERTEIERLRETANRELNEGQDALKIAQSKLVDFSEEIEHSTRARQTADEDRSQAQATLNHVTTKVSSVEERRVSLKATLERLKRQEREVSVRREKLDGLTQRSTTSLSELKQKVAEDESELAHCENAMLEKADEVRAAKEAMTVLFEKSEHHKKATQSTRNQLDDAREALNPNATCTRVYQVAFRSPWAAN